MTATLQQMLENLEQVKQHLQYLMETSQTATKPPETSDANWVVIDHDNCPTLEKWGVKPFKIMRKKMRRGGKVWNKILFDEAKVVAKKRGCSLPTLKQMLALLDYYKKIDCQDDDEFLGIEELGEDYVRFEWVDPEIKEVSFLRGDWAAPSAPGLFSLSFGSTNWNASVGFRLVKEEATAYKNPTISTEIG